VRLSGRVVAGSWYPAIVLLLLLQIGGCGFHLRGMQDGAIVLPPIYISGSDGNETVHRLKDYLRAAGVDVLSDSAGARMVATVSDEIHQRRVLSVGTTGKVQEYELRFAVRFSAADGSGTPLSDEQTVSLVRDYSFDEVQVTAKDIEAGELYDVMRTDAVRAIARRLQALSRVE